MTLPSALFLLLACSPDPEPTLVVNPTPIRQQTLHALGQDPPPESDLPPLAAGSWSLACGAALDLQASGPLEILERGGLRTLGGQAVGTPAVDKARTRFAWAHAPQARPETVVSVMRCEGRAWGEPRTLVEGPGSPDRVAISPDGAWVVWVSGVSGVASLWAAPFEGGDPIQLTSADIDAAQASPGSPPPGFLAPPHKAPPSIELLETGRYRVSWLAPDGEHSLELP
jgi:hypothetical protein